MGSAVDQAVRDAVSNGEVGIQVAAYHRGELVVDSCAGHAREGGEAVDPGVVFFAASAGKVSTATLVHRFAELGLLAYDQPITSLWPEFAAHRKQSYTVRDALTHRVGLAAVPPEVVTGDWDDIIDRIAQLPPDPDPSTHDTYHAFTWGYIVGEIARRADPARRTFEELIREEVHEPLGIDELWHALPETEHARTATVKGSIFRGEPFDLLVTPDHPFNSAPHRMHLDPSGAWMTARAGARLWALYAEEGSLAGVRLLSRERVRTLSAPRENEHSLGILVGPRGIMGRGGLMLGDAVPSHRDVLGFGRHVLWHPGAGGTVGFADLDAGISGMICHNELFDERGEPQHPFAPLIRAIYTDVLG